MASQGPNFPSSGSNDDSGGVSWGSITNCYTSNNLRAVVNGGGNTDYLKLTGFGFSIPSGATIDGIEVVFEGYAYIGGGSFGNLNITKLVKAGTLVGTDQDSNNNISSFGVDVSVTIGSSTNLWGTTWTDTDINSSDFGVAVSIYIDPGKFGGQGNCDTMTIKVYYTEGGGGGAVVAKSNFMILETDD